MKTIHGEHVTTQTTHTTSTTHARRARRRRSRAPACALVMAIGLTGAMSFVSGCRSAPAPRSDLERAISEMDHGRHDEAGRILDRMLSADTHRNGSDRDGSRLSSTR